MPLRIFGCCRTALYASFALAIGLSSAAVATDLAPGEQRIFAPDDGVDFGDGFGCALAMDGEWAVVGAKDDDVEADTDAGAVYLLHRNGTAWSITQKISAPGGVDVPRQFGAAAALFGDVMAIGAPGRANFDDIGHVFVFRRSGTIWNQEAQLDAPQASPRGQFGAALAFDGNTLVVGDPNPSGKGRVVIYEHSAANGWYERQQLTQPTFANGTRFGASVAVVNNVILVGCPGPDIGSFGGLPGRVFEYRVVNGQWTGTRVQSHPFAKAYDQFGAAVALAGGRALIGAPRGDFASDSTSSRGTAHVYNVAEVGWTLVRSFDIDGLSGTTAFGFRIALSGQRALIAAKKGTSGVVAQVKISGQAPITWPVTLVSGGGRGDALAVNDIAGLIASQGTYAFNPSVGNVLSVFDINGSLFPGATLVPPRTRQRGGMGAAVAISGDVAVVGAPAYDNLEFTSVGCAYILERQAGEWRIINILDSPLNDRDGGRFGADVAIDGNRIVIAAPGSDWMAGTPGEVFIYERGPNGWPSRPSVTLAPTDNETAFGQNMTLSGSRLALTAQNRYGNPPTVMVYEMGQGNIFRGPTTNRFPNTAYGAGSTLAVHGDVLALHEGPQSQTAAGSVALFDISPQAALIRRLTLMPPGAPTNPLSDFGALLALDEGLLALSDDQSERWLQTYQRANGTWKKLDGVPRPMDDSNTPSCQSLALANGNLFVGLFGDAALYQRSGNGWRLARSICGVGASRADAFGYQVALNQDTLVVTDLQSISFFPMADAALADGPPALTLQKTSGATIDLGEFAVGTATDIPLTFVNRGVKPLRVTGATVTWSPVKASFNTATVPADPVAAGAIDRVLLTILPPAEGEYEAILKLHTDDAALGDLVFAIHHTAVATPHLPPQVLPFGPALEKAGNPIVLNPEIIGTRIYTCQWFKDGKVLPGQTQHALFIPASKPADAGRYRLQLTWFGGDITSADILVGLYEEQRGNLDLRPDQSFKWAARVWGPGVKVRWDVPSETAFVRGTHTPTLDVVRADAVPSPLNASAVLGRVIKPFVTFVIHLRAPPVLAVSVLPSVLTKGDAVATPAIMDVSSAEVAPSFAATGLPVGLSLDAHSGELSGTPIRSGIYTIRFTARNAYGIATPLVWRIKVVDAPESDFGQPGGFAGLINMPSVNDGVQQAALFRSGLITARVEMTGAISGQISAGRERRSFAGRLNVPAPLSDTRSNEFSLAPLNGSRRTVLRLSQSAELIGSLVLVYGADTEIELPLQLDPVVAELALRPVVLSGQYNILLPMPANDPGVPQGTGFMSLKLGSGDTATAAGTLPNGAGFTASLPLVRSSSLGASLLLAANNPEGDAVSAQILWYELGFGIEPDLYSEFHWSHAARPRSRLYPEPVPDIALNIIGGRYFPPAPGSRILPQLEDGADLAMLVLAGGGIESSSAAGSLLQVFNVTAQHKAVVPGLAGNPLKPRLDFFAPTGFFTGSFTLDDPIPDSTRLIKRVVGFRGMILASRNEGGGFFLLPQLPDPSATPPTTINTSPILSGSVSLVIPSVGP